MNEKLKQLERDTIAAIEALQAEYRRAAEPYIKRLLEIRGVNLAPIFVLKDEARQAIADAEQSPAVGQWQPIETVPRDGSRFLAIQISQYNDKPSPFICYSSLCPEGQTWAVGAGLMQLGRDWPVYPTHWMPLPAAPTQERTDGDR